MAFSRLSLISGKWLPILFAYELTLDVFARTLKPIHALIPIIANVAANAEIYPKNITLRMFELNSNPASSETNIKAIIINAVRAIIEFLESLNKISFLPVSEIRLIKLL